MNRYVLQLIFWTGGEDGRPRPQLQRQYVIRATSDSAAWDVASMLMGHEPLVGYRDHEAVQEMGVNLQRIQQPRDP